MLREVENNLVKKNLMVTNANLVSGLAKKGLKDVDRSKLYRLKLAMNYENNFVLNIAESQYSAMIQDIYDKLLFVEDKVAPLCEQDWTVETISTGDGDRNNFVKSESNQHKPKVDFYRLIVDIQTAKMKLLTGDIMNVSVAMIEKNFSKIRDERDDYKKEIKRLREKLDKKDG